MLKVKLYQNLEMSKDYLMTRFQGILEIPAGKFAYKLHPKCHAIEVEIPGRKGPFEICLSSDFKKKLIAAPDDALLKELLANALNTHNFYRTHPDSSQCKGFKITDDRMKFLFYKKENWTFFDRLKAFFGLTPLEKRVECLTPEFYLSNYEQFKDLLLKSGPEGMLSLFHQIERSPGIQDKEGMKSAYFAYLKIAFEDSRIFAAFLKKPKIGELFKEIGGHPEVRQIFINSKEALWENRATRQVLQKIYPMEDLENSECYPFTVREGQGPADVQILAHLGKTQNNPEEVLTMLADHIRSSPYFPTCLRVHFYGQKGIDAGGLGRQFMSTLFHSFVASPSSPIRCEKKDNKKYLLTLQDAHQVSPQERERYGQLGTLLAFLMSTRIPYPIGAIFDESFFRILANFDLSDMYQTTENYLNHLNLHQFFMYCSFMEHDNRSAFNRIQMTQSISLVERFEDLTREQLNYFENILWIDIDAENFQEEKQRLINDLKKTYLNKIGAVHATALGFFTHVPMRSLSPEQMQFSIQGVVNRQDLKAAVLVKPVGDPKAEEVQQWFGAWIDQATEAQMEMLLKYITGAPALTSGKIVIYLRDNDIVEGMPAQTCFRSLEVSKSVTQEGFFLGLNNYSTEEVKTFGMW